MIISKLTIEKWQEQLAKGMIPFMLLAQIGDILSDLESLHKRELDEQHSWHCMECNKTFVRPENRCVCKLGE